MVASGYDVVVEERIETRKSLLPQMNDIHMLSLLDVPAGLSESIDAFKTGYLDELVTDNSRGMAMLDGFICVVGQKPRSEGN